MAIRIICLLGMFFAGICHGHIYRWDNGEVIRGTEGLLVLPGATLSYRDLAFADFAGRNVARVDFTFSNLDNADFSDATDHLTVQVQSNRSRTWFELASLRGANLVNANFGSTVLRRADLRGANLSNAILHESSVRSAIFDTSTVYNQWTVFDGDFVPVTAGLTFVPSPPGDFDANDVLDAADINRFARKL
jgi:hypothetical protein